MAILFRSAATGGNGMSGGFVTIPSDVQEGDLLLAVMDVNDLNMSAGVPAGWERLQSSQGFSGGGSQFAELYWKRAGAADANGDVTFAVTPPGSKQAVSLAAYYSDTAGQWVTVAASAYRSESSAGATHAAPIVNVASLPARVVSAIGKKGTTVSSFTEPSGYTMRGAPSFSGGTSNNGTALADKESVATGNTAGSAWSVNVSNIAATTFSVVLSEGVVQAAPTASAPRLRRWNGTAWTTVL